MTASYCRPRSGHKLPKDGSPADPTKVETVTPVERVRLIPAGELEKAQSTYKEGVLEVRVPKAIGTKPTSKKVEIVFDTPADETRIKALLAEINYPVAA